MILQLSVAFLSHKPEAHSLHDNGGNPGSRIGDEQEIQRAVLWEKHINPQNSHSHRPDNGQHHGNRGVPHSPQGAGQQIHDAAQEIGNRGDRQNFQSALYHFPVRGINPQYLGAKHPARSCAREWNASAYVCVHALPAQRQSGARPVRSEKAIGSFPVAFLQAFSQKARLFCFAARRLPTVFREPIAFSRV